MLERNGPVEGWRPKRSFTNTDARAVKLAELLHELKKPHLTILFGSRARGDYSEGRSDVDILLIKKNQPDDPTSENCWSAFRKAM